MKENDALGIRKVQFERKLDEIKVSVLLERFAYYFVHENELGSMGSISVFGYKIIYFNSTTIFFWKGNMFCFSINFLSFNRF